MNEKIRELAEQAGIGLVPLMEGAILDGNEKNLEKFAESIIKECTNVCRTEWLANSSAQRYGNQCADSIEYNFNVKETI